MLLSLGSKGDSVKFLQSGLNILELSKPKLVVDGIFGQLTKEKVMAYQKQKGLLVDGIVGTNTQNAISSDLKKIPNTSAILTDPGFENEKPKTGFMPVLILGSLLFFILKKK